MFQGRCQRVQSNAEDGAKKHWRTCATLRAQLCKVPTAQMKKKSARDERRELTEGFLFQGLVQGHGGIAA